MNDNGVECDLENEIEQVPNGGLLGADEARSESIEEYLECPKIIRVNVRLARG